MYKQQSCREDIVMASDIVGTLNAVCFIQLMTLRVGWTARDAQLLAQHSSTYRKASIVSLCSHLDCDINVIIHRRRVNTLRAIPSATLEIGVTRNYCRYCHRRQFAYNFGGVRLVCEARRAAAWGSKGWGSGGQPAPSLSARRSGGAV